jgi:hypothetical protein
LRGGNPQNIADVRSNLKPVGENHRNLHTVLPPDNTLQPKLDDLKNKINANPGNYKLVKF